MDKKHSFCLHFTNTHAKAFIARFFCFALIWFYKCDICKRAFSTWFFFQPMKSISCIQRPLTKACWQKPLKCGKKIFFMCLMCVFVCECEDKSENKTKQKQESTKNRWQMLFQVVCSLAHIYCLIAYVALLIFFVIHKQKHSRVYEYACTQTQTHRNTDIVQWNEMLDCGRGAR